MRAFLATICLTLGLAAHGFGARADGAASRQKAPPQRVTVSDREFRLLELGGRKVRWAIPDGGLPTTVTYAFVTQPMRFPGARNCDAMTAPDAALKPSGVAAEAFRREVEAAFAAWSQVANIVFRETQTVAEAGILIGADAKPRGRAFTNVALREDRGHAPAAMGAIRQSLICLNPQQPWKIGFDGNLDVYDVRYTVMHEIGHAIGLDHPSPEGQLMSFRYVEAARGLQQGDMAGAIALYGKRSAREAPSEAGLLRGEAPRPSGDRTFGLGERGPSEGPR